MNTERLRQLYNATSKHSNYQELPAALQNILRSDEVSVRTRHESARLQYICSKIDLRGLSVADIGGNTGYFSFEVLEKGAKSVAYYEGNREHYEFVTEAAELLTLNGKLQTFNEYVDFQAASIPRFDCILLLNVLHHVGDDYGDQSIGVDVARQDILRSIAELSRRTRWLVFQLGFNWKGDVNLPIFEHGTKEEMINFVSEGTKMDWELRSTGIAEKNDNGIEFRDLNSTNIERDDALGEFLNRPLFVLRSRAFK